MTAYRMLGRLTATIVLAGALDAPAHATDRPTGGLADAPPATAPAAPGAPPPVGVAGLVAEAPLPGGSIPLRALAAPPARGAASGAGDLVLQGGGGGAPRLRYYGVDALGSVRVVFDAAGQVISRADYEPFGAAVPASTTGGLPRQQFTGQERDGEVGVDYFGARLYQPNHGRMMSVDPKYSGAIENPQRWNRFAYGLNSPLGHIDPDGREIICSSRTACSESITVSANPGSGASLHGVSPASLADSVNRRKWILETEGAGPRCRTLCMALSTLRESSFQGWEMLRIY